MMNFNNLKTIALAVLIGVGILVQPTPVKASETETIKVAGGCFWCVEADFEKVKGVKEAISGFTGGSTENPTYKQVTGGNTGHYEAVQIIYDPTVIGADQILDLFFRSIDPTDANGQFCDRGSSYRTAIFATSAQEATARKAKADAQAALGREVVTPVLDSQPFYPAEEYHQDYYKKDDLVLTRFGPKRKSKAYTAYRDACGRDERVRALWGKDAPFAS